MEFRNASHARPRTLAAFTLASVVALISACGGSDSPPPPPPPQSADYKATVRLTQFGVPHITAASYGDLGAGVGYAQSKDTICELFDRVKVASGTVASYDGPGTNNANVNSDLYYAWLRTKVTAWLAEPATSIQSPSQNARDLIAGWVAGINTYLEEVGGAAGIPDTRCQGAAHVRPLTLDDGWMYVATAWETVGSITNSSGIRAAIPPSAVASQTCPAIAASSTPASRSAAPQARIWNAVPSQADVPPGEDATDREEDGGVGSNAYGLGRLATKSGNGMLLSNPHWYWTGPNRFYRMHLTIPGEMNVAGVSFINMPWILIGYNESAGWSHTLSTARRTGYWGLQLDPADPTKYLYEGSYEPMTATCVSAQVKQPDGSMETVNRAFYTTRWGPVVRTTALPWTATKAYAARDPGEGLRIVDQYLALAKAKNVNELSLAMNKYAAIGTNTIAADSEGRSFYGDIGHVPNVTAEQVSGISGSAPGACLDADVGVAQWAQRYPAFDGSKASCGWQTDPGSVPGLSGLASGPHMFRDDYVSNSNDSYWLTNASAPLEGYLRIYGDERTARTLRTRMGLQLVADRLAGTDGLGAPGFDVSTLKSVMFNNRVMSSELARDALVAQCANVGYLWNGVDLSQACQTLATWDTRYNTTSRGAAIWRQFVTRGGLSWAVPFDAAAPATTPNTLAVGNPSVMNALATAVTNLNDNNIPLTAMFGDVQGITRQGERFPIPGGITSEGVFNVIPSVGNLVRDVGWVPNTLGTGASIIMAIEFTPQGPKGAALLTYGQSTNPDSPHFIDQTRLFSQGQWDTVRFSEEEVSAATLSTVEVTAPKP